VASRSAAVALLAHSLRPCAASGTSPRGLAAMSPGPPRPAERRQPRLDEYEDRAHSLCRPRAPNRLPRLLSRRAHQCLSSLSRRQPRLYGAKAAKAPSRPLGLTIVLMTGTLCVARGCFPIGYCPKSKTKRLETSHGAAPSDCAPAYHTRKMQRQVIQVSG
jgi:hypothetical protein